MFHDKISTDLQKAVVDLGFIYPSDTVVSISENVLFGDYSSNIALQLSKQKHQKNYQSPREIANAIIDALGHPQYLERIDVAGPGFINFYLKNQSLVSLLTEDISAKPQDDYATRFLTEFGHLNTHKEFHIGHLRTLSIGESLSRILIYQGHPVFKVDYGSDIGPPVAKALWGVMNKKTEYETAKQNPSLKEKAQFLGQAYAFAHAKYEEDPAIKAEIDQLNTKIYQKDPSIVPLWEETKEWSLLYFASVYLKLGTEFDARINESEVADTGKEIVLANLDSVFIKDQGAIIFPGEKFGLHNQVYINSQGHPTYEGKELGLTQKEAELFPFDISLHIVDSQQTDFFKGVNKALEQIEKNESKKKHIPYGFVSLSTGRMSSRKGNIISAEDLITQVSAEIEKNFPTKLPAETMEKIAVAAIKFFYLKYGLTSDIVYDVEKSVALHGDTGPYVLYVYARIHSLLLRSESKVSLLLRSESKVSLLLRSESKVSLLLRSESKVSLLDRAKGSEAEKDIEEDQTPEIAQSFDSDALAQDEESIPEDLAPLTVQTPAELEATERELLRQMEYFTPMIQMTAKELQPSQITIYLLGLAKAFNQFYEKCPIFGGGKTEFRLALAKATGERIKLGLYLLGIETVEKM